MNIKFPFQINQLGCVAVSGHNDHIREMIEQVLFTSPGERVNRPDFGCALLQQVFQPLTDELAGTMQFLVQGSLNQWLGNLIEVNAVDVRRQGATLCVRVVYTIRQTGERNEETFTQPVS